MALDSHQSLSRRPSSIRVGPREERMLPSRFGSRRSILAKVSIFGCILLVVLGLSFGAVSLVRKRPGTVSPRTTVPVSKLAAASRISSIVSPTRTASSSVRISEPLSPLRRVANWIYEHPWTVVVIVAVVISAILVATVLSKIQSQSTINSLPSSSSESHHDDTPGQQVVGGDSPTLATIIGSSIGSLVGAVLIAALILAACTDRLPKWGPRASQLPDPSQELQSPILQDAGKLQATTFPDQPVAASVKELVLHSTDKSLFKPSSSSSDQVSSDESPLPPPEVIPPLPSSKEDIISPPPPSSKGESIEPLPKVTTPTKKEIPPPPPPKKEIPPPPPPKEAVPSPSPKRELPPPPSKVTPVPAQHEAVPSPEIVSPPGQPEANLPSVQSVAMPQPAKPHVAQPVDEPNWKTFYEINARKWLDKPDRTASLEVHRQVVLHNYKLFRDVAYYVRFVDDKGLPRIWANIWCPRARDLLDYLCYWWTLNDPPADDLFIADRYHIRDGKESKLLPVGPLALKDTYYKIEWMGSIGKDYQTVDYFREQHDRLNSAAMHAHARLGKPNYPATNYEANNPDIVKQAMGRGPNSKAP